MAMFLKTTFLFMNPHDLGQLALLLSPAMLISVLLFISTTPLSFLIDQCLTGAATE